MFYSVALEALIFMHVLLWLQFLSMRLAAVNPRIDFNLDSILAAEVSMNSFCLTSF